MISISSPLSNIEAKGMEGEVQLRLQSMAKIEAVILRRTARGGGRTESIPFLVEIAAMVGVGWEPRPSREEASQRVVRLARRAAASQRAVPFMGGTLREAEGPEAVRP